MFGASRTGPGDERPARALGCAPWQAPGARLDVRVRLQSGLQAKDLGTEEAYYRFLAWCNQRGVPLSLRALKLLKRSSHGWVEFVEHER